MAYVSQCPPIMPDGRISRAHAVGYLVHAGPGIAFAVLGAAFLALTGAEAMYADMGHFGRRPIQLGWFAIVLPALMLNYFGQGGLPGGPPRRREPVLPARTKVGPLSDGRVRYDGHRDRLAIHHLRRVLPHPAGDATRLPAPHAGAAHG